jgi:hypothetical protein
LKQEEKKCQCLGRIMLGELAFFNDYSECLVIHERGTLNSVICLLWDMPYIYRGADKSLARPGRKQATATEDFKFHVYYL